MAVQVSAYGCEVAEDTIAVPADAGSAVPPTCPGPATAAEGVVALYPFDGDDGSALVADVVGGHDGSVQAGAVATTAGPESCDRALTFGADQFVVIDDSADWDLEVGSIDLWAWLPAESTENVALVSRDLVAREDPGHASIYVDENGLAVARVQPADASGDLDAVSCSAAPLPREEWVHLGLNFGPPAVEFYVDGVLADGAGPHAIDDAWSCGQAGAFGIAGNDLPWLLGATTFRGDAPLDNVEFFAEGYAIDHLRISAERQDFASLP